LLRFKTIACVSLGVALVGCGSGATVSDSSNGTASAYLGQGPNFALFLQWTLAGTSASGSLNESYIKPADPYHVGTLSAAFTGVISGSSLTLTFPQGFGNSTSWSGTLHGSELTLNYPNSNGTLASLQMLPANVDDYNGAVASLETNAGQAQARQATLQTQQANEQATVGTQQTETTAQDQSRQAIDADADHVRQDLQGVAGDSTSPGSDLRSMASDLQTERKDLATTYHDEQTWLTQGQSGTIRASDVNSDASNVNSDANTVSADGYAVQRDLYTLQSDIGRLTSDFRQLQNDESSLPSYQPIGLPSQGQVSGAVGSANAVISQSKQTMAGYWGQASSMPQQAHAYVSAAYSKDRSG